MELNSIEQRLMKDILQVELDVPVAANLKVNNEDFPVTVVPQIAQGSHFEMRYFGTPAYIPESTDGTRTWSDDQVLGVHPSLKDAWNNQEDVELEFADRPQHHVPFRTISGPNVLAKVLVAEPGHKGRLTIHKNQVKREESTLKRVVFSLVDFSNFKRVENFPDVLIKHVNIRESINAIRNEFPDTVDIQLVRPPRISLQAGQEWNITITENAERTRGHVSHTGQISKPEEKEFEVWEMDDLLTGLNCFFAFVSCAYRHPTAIIGENSQGEAVWGQIGRFDLMPRSTNWFDNNSWAPATVYLESLFPKFWEQWQKHPEELYSVIESHINSKAMRHAGLPKEAIAASYSGLDVLSSLVLANPDPSDSVANVHQALKEHGIPNLRLRKSATPLTTQLANKLGVGRSGPHVIYSVRNYVVHPLDSNTAAVKQQHLEHLDDNYSPYFYLHDLCQFYLEYLLLVGLCDWRPQHFRALTEKRRNQP